MRTAKVQSISLPPELQKQAEETRQEMGMTSSELYRAAIRRFIEQEKRWQKLQTIATRQAKKQGLNTEEKVMRAALAYRQARRKRRA